jgi:FdhD protein
MPDKIQSVRIDRITGSRRKGMDDPVTVEMPLKIVLNNRDLAALLCSPDHLDYLAAGYLFSEGIISSREDIRKLLVDEKSKTVFIETENEEEPCQMRGSSWYKATEDPKQFEMTSQLKVTPQDIFKLVDAFQDRWENSKEETGVHNSALCNREKILIVANDIGRHNTIDRIIGEVILNDISTDNCLVITSGRISSEIVIKVARRKIPFLVSRSSPASLGIRLAEEFGMTLIGFVRGHRMNVYSHSWRII